MVVMSGDVLPTAKESWKPLVVVLLVTSIPVRDSMTNGGAGRGTPGPMSSVRWMLLNTGRSGNAAWERDAEPAPDRRDELVRLHGAVRVGQAPEQLGIAEVARGDLVEPVLLDRGVLGDE